MICLIGQSEKNTPVAEWVTLWTRKTNNVCFLWCLVHGQPFLILFSDCVSIFPYLPHTHFLPFLPLSCFISCIPPSFSTVSISPAGHWVYSTATSILRVRAVVAHSTGTLHCDVARCPMAALHNPMWSLCWLDLPVFTQAPRACHDPAAPATLRGAAASSLKELLLWDFKCPQGTFFNAVHKSQNVWCVTVVIRECTRARKRWGAPRYYCIFTQKCKKNNIRSIELYCHLNHLHVIKKLLRLCLYWARVHNCSRRHVFKGVLLEKQMPHYPSIGCTDK